MYKMISSSQVNFIKSLLPLKALKIILSSRQDVLLSSALFIPAVTVDDR